MYLALLWRSISDAAVVPFTGARGAGSAAVVTTAAAELANASGIGHGVVESVAGRSSGCRRGLPLPQSCSVVAVLPSAALPSAALPSAALPSASVAAAAKMPDGSASRLPPSPPPNWPAVCAAPLQKTRYCACVTAAAAVSAAVDVQLLFDSAGGDWSSGGGGGGDSGSGSELLLRVCTAGTAANVCSTTQLLVSGGWRAAAHVGSCHDHWGTRLCTGGQTAYRQHYSPRQQCLAPETPPRVQQIEIRVIVRQLR